MDILLLYSIYSPTCGRKQISEKKHAYIYIQEQFCFELPSVILAHRKMKFEVTFFGNFAK